MVTRLMIHQIQPRRHGRHTNDVSVRLGKFHGHVCADTVRAAKLDRSHIVRRLDVDGEHRALQTINESDLIQHPRSPDTPLREFRDDRVAKSWH